MMNIELVEKELVNLLTAKLENNSKTEVISIGEHDGDYELPFGKRKIIVAFSNEEPDPNSNSFDMINQPTIVVFSILLQSKFLNGMNGVYAMSSFVKTQITGFQPTDGESFRYAGFRFEQKVKNVFEYSLDFKTKTMVVQQTYKEEAPKFKTSNYL